MPSISRLGLTGRKSTVAVTPSRLSTNVNLVANEGVQILASPANSENMYVGYGSGITANSGDATDGFPIAPGASIFVPCRHPADIWVASITQPNLVLWFILQ